jgi:hypothetical protein
LSYIKEQEGAKAGFGLMKYADHRVLLTEPQKLWQERFGRRNQQLLFTWPM